MHIENIHSLAKYMMLCACLWPWLLHGQPWRVAAEASIEAERMSDVGISLVDKQGHPISGAAVELRMKRHQFRWGTVMNIEFITGLALQGYPIGSDHPYYTHMLNFNSVTPGNAGKWKFWTVDATRKRYLEAMEWLEQYDVLNRGHTTIWPSISRWNAVPDTVLNAMAIVEGGAVLTSREDVVRDIIKGHIEEQLPILANYVYEIDLINELVHEGEIVKDVLNIPVNQRPAEHALWYRWAKAVTPELPLIANEYDLYQSGNNFHNQFVQYIREIQAAGAAIDGVGLQGHFFSTVPPYTELKKRLAEVAVLNLPMAITEFDMVNNTYEEMERILYSCFSEPLVNGFTMWGAWDGRQWRGNGPMYNLDWSLKESGQAWYDLVKSEWWTDTTMISTESGAVATRGFLGEYDLFITYDDKVYVQSLIVPKEGVDLKITLDDLNAYPIPEVVLLLESDKDAYYLNEPVDITVESPDSIVSVLFYDGLQVIAPSAHPFSLSLTRDHKSTVWLSADVEFASGYRTRTPRRALNFSLNNAKPSIQQLFPPDGSLLLVKDTIELFVTANDPTADPLQVMLYDETGLIVAVDTSYPFVLPLQGFKQGVHRFRVLVQDDKYGLDERAYQLNLVDGNGTNVSVGIPLGQDDDIEESGDGSITLAGDLDLGDRLNAIRFPFVSLPQGAFVDSAFIQFSSQKNEQSGRTVLVFHGEADPEAVPFNNTAKNISQRVFTSSKVSWEPEDWLAIGDHTLTQRSPDIAEIIQELVQLPGWSTQSPVHIIVDFEAGLSKRSAFSYDLLKEQAPALTVYFRSDFAAAIPKPPHNFSFAAINDFLGTLQWQPKNEDPILGYKVRLLHEPEVRVVSRPVISLFDLEADSLYKVQVKTVGNLGIESAWSEPFSFQVTTTPIEQANFASRIRLHPNPVIDILHLEGELFGIKEVQIHSLEGSYLDVLSWDGRQNAIDVRALVSGFYILKFVQDDGTVYSKRFIKQ